MSATDILRICDEVLAASKEATPPPWEYDGFTITKWDGDKIEIEWGPLRDSKRNRERDGQYIAIAANAAPALAEYVKRMHEALAAIAAGMGNLSLEQIETDVNGINDGKQRSIYLAAFIKIAREALDLDRLAPR